MKINYIMRWDDTHREVIDRGNSSHGCYCPVKLSAYS
jgi:hypothetical protein